MTPQSQSPMTDPIAKRCGVVSVEEARGAVLRFINSLFGGAHPRISIPARPEYDDDIRLCEFVDQAAAVMDERVRLATMCAGYEEKFDMQREIVCAALAWRAEPIGQRSNEPETAVDALNEWTASVK